MELVYLANGQSCYLKEKIGEKFIINKIFEYEQFYGDGDSEMVEIVDESDVVVDEIFKTPPTQKFSSEVSELIKKKDELQKDIKSLLYEKSSLRKEIENLTKTKIENDKFILNKTELINAKTLALFAKDSIMPMVLDSKDKMFSGLKVSMETNILTNGENYWGYKLWFNGDYQSGNFLCPKYGILINPTEDEIEETIKKRLSEFEFPNYKIAAVDDKYLTESQIAIKNSYLSKKQEEEREKLKKNIAEIQEKLNRLNENN